MSIQPLSKQNLNTIELILSQESSKENQDVSALEKVRLQLISESGVVSGFKNDEEVQTVLQCIKGYEGATLERVNAVRSKMIKETEMMDAYPVDYRNQSLDIINAYLGFDKAQADVMETTISETMRHGTEEMSKDISRCQHFSSDQQALFQDFILAMKSKIESLPFAHSASPIEASKNGDQMHEMGSVLFETVKEFIQNNTHRIPTEEREKFAQFKEELTTAQKKFSLEAYSDKLTSPYLPQTMLKLDKPYMTQLIREIVLTQKKCAASLPASVFKEGTSQSITFAIKKESQARGYLFGTLHYLLFIPGGKRLTKLSKEVQSRLYECAILGTEIRFPKDKICPSNSIDETLAEFASSRGIPHIGIDSADRDMLISTEVDLVQAKKKGEEAYDDVMFQVQQQIHAIHDGDKERYKTALEQRTSRSKELDETMPIRNQEMADNIDTLLNACETVGNELQEKPPMAFFAVGAEHIVSTKQHPLSVAELLAKKGWTLELILPIKS